MLENCFSIFATGPIKFLRVLSTDCWYVLVPEKENEGSIFKWVSSCDFANYRPI